MGQKVNPKILRLGSLYTWSGHWFDDKTYKDTLYQDYLLRKAMLEKLKNAGVSEVQIDRSINSIKVIVYVARPGIVVGRGGSGLEELKTFLNSLVVSKNDKKNILKVDIRVEPIKEPNLDAYLVAKSISDQIIKRLPAKRILTQAVERAMMSGAKGVRILLSGRISGADIARRQKIQRGTVPLSTIREHVTFASVPALTSKGYVGVKVWINKP